MAASDSESRGAPCPYCGGATARRFAARDWNQRSTDRLFEYRSCGQCGLIALHPMPEDWRRYYVHEQYDIPADGQGFDARAATQGWKLDLLRPFIVGGDLLEVGPATGEFATVARQQGFRPKLIEMDTECCAFLRDVLGHDVVQSGEPSRCLGAGDRFDAICVWQAIEHVPRFWEFIEAAAGCLRPGGVLAISTPNPDSLQARWLGRYWPHIDAPRHLYLIPPSWFRQFAATRGFRVAQLTTRDVGSLGLNYYGWYLWMLKQGSRVVTAARAQRWAARWTRAVRPWEEREGRGCSYVVILIKQ
jgi:2-polyprenyl-3-methyl-5-hydroxy-6-metoxy-1,4-benzoquinol methylase